MLEYHDDPQPELCHVCAYARETSDADQRLEHTLTLTAAAVISLDIEQFGQPRSFRAIAIESIGWPGPEQPIEPRHWYWALIEEPRFMVSIAGWPDEGAP